MFGYYIEVTNSHKEKAPVTWTRKQTTTNSERYITLELKDFENDALGARDKSIALEQQLFEQIRQSLLPHVTAFQELAYGRRASGCAVIAGRPGARAALLPADD